MRGLHVSEKKYLSAERKATTLESYLSDRNSYFLHIYAHVRAFAIQHVHVRVHNTSLSGQKRTNYIKDWLRNTIQTTVIRQRISTQVSRMTRN